MHGACAIGVYFNKPLCEDTEPVAELLDELNEAGFVDVESWTQLFCPIARRNAQAKPYVRESVLRTVARGKSFWAGVGNGTRVNQQESFEMIIGCAPPTQPVYDIYGEPIEDPVWRYRLKCAVGAALAKRGGIPRLIDILLNFASKVDSTTVVILTDPNALHAIERLGQRRHYPRGSHPGAASILDGACAVGIYFNKPLCEDTQPVAELLDALSEAGFVDAENWTQRFTPIAQHDAQPAPYDRDSVLRTMARAESREGCVGTFPETNQLDSFTLCIDCAPATQPVYYEDELVERPVWRYRLRCAVGAALATRGGVPRLIDIMRDFAFKVRSQTLIITNEGEPFEQLDELQPLPMRKRDDP